MKEDLLIFPYSGTGIETLDCLGDKFNCVGFISDDKEKIGTFYHQYEIFDRSVIQKNQNTKIIAVHGSATSFTKRKEIIASLNISIKQFCSVIHPSATVSKYAKIGNNVLIMAHVSIGPNVNIEDNVIILPNTTIHHDSLVKQNSIICGSVLIAGNVTIQDNCYIGAKTSIISNCLVGTKTIVGMGSNVIRNVAPNSKVVGNPTRDLI